MASVLLKTGVTLSGRLNSVKGTTTALGQKSSSWTGFNKSSLPKPVAARCYPGVSLSSHAVAQSPILFRDERRGFHSGRSLADIFVIQDEKDFKAKVVNSKKPVVVQFHATWCGPCKLLMPRLEKSLIKYHEKVDLALVDIDALPEVAMAHNVGAVPSVMAMKNGKVFTKFVGLKDDDQIDKFLQEASSK